MQNTLAKEDKMNVKPLCIYAFSILILLSGTALCDTNILTNPGFGAAQSRPLHHLPLTVELIAQGLITELTHGREYSRT